MMAPPIRVFELLARQQKAQAEFLLSIANDAAFQRARRIVQDAVSFVYAEEREHAELIDIGGES